MSGTKISAMTNGTNVQTSDTVPLVRAGANVKANPAIYATTVGVGAATPAASGAGVTFPATQSASSDVNTLDDYVEGSYTATLTGCTTSPTYSVTYTKIGNTVILQVPATTATSNATTKSLTGMPSALQPATQKRGVVVAVDNGGSPAVSEATVETSGVMNFFFNPENAWTASGTFATRTWCFSYTLA